MTECQEAPVAWSPRPRLTQSVTCTEHCSVTLIPKGMKTFPHQHWEDSSEQKEPSFRAPVPTVTGHAALGTLVHRTPSCPGRCCESSRHQPDSWGPALGPTLLEREATLTAKKEEPLSSSAEREVTAKVSARPSCARGRRHLRGRPCLPRTTTCLAPSLRLRDFFTQRGSQGRSPLRLPLTDGVLAPGGGGEGAARSTHSADTGVPSTPGTWLPVTVFFSCL